jgi:hypothetical protein
MLKIAALGILLAGCAMTRARVTEIGGGRYMIATGGNGFANTADTEQRAVEEAVQVCAPQGRSPVFDDLRNGTSSMSIATINAYGGSASRVQRPNSTLYFHCQ